MNPYIADILAQPSALRQAITQYPTHLLEPIQQRLALHKFDRIILSGMGASFNASYPAFLRLSNLPIPVSLLNTAELLHSLRGQIGSRTLLWLSSQSGRSIELVSLMGQIKSRPPACILTSVNDETSPLATDASVCLPIHAGQEATVSTKTYLNMAAVNYLAALQLSGCSISTYQNQMLSVADAIESYLQEWQAHVAKMDALLGNFKNIFILGRGISLGTAWNGALICKEAAKVAVEGMQTADFRHGPLELAEPGLCVLVLAGSPESAHLNYRLASEIKQHGGHVIWVDFCSDERLPSISFPEAPNFARPLVEILPLQMLTIALAERKNILPGSFRIVGKVTNSE